MYHIMYFQLGVSLISCCTNLIYFFLSISIKKVLFWFHPLLIFFLFKTKGGEHCFIVFFDPFVEDWQKKGEVFEFICMFIVCFILISRTFVKFLLLISKSFIDYLPIGIKNFYWLNFFIDWYQELLCCFCWLSFYIEIFIRIKSN